MGAKNSIIFSGRMGRWVTFEPFDVRAIGWQNSLADSAGSQRRAAGASHVTIFIDGAETGDGIKLFTRDIRVVNLSLEFDFFIAATPTAPADIFPQTDTRQIRILQIFLLQ